MVYQINVQIESAKREEFIKIIESFKKLGLVRDYLEPIAKDETGDTVSDSALLEMVQISRQQIAEGKGLTTQQAKDRVKTWRKT